MKKIKKILALFIVLSFLVPSFSIAADPITADDLAGLVPVDDGIVTPDDIGAEASALQNRVTGPQVQITFDKQYLKAGDQVTANAIPSGFKDVSGKNLYYTWYLKKSGCDLNKGDVSKCDMDGNGKITVNDWKIEAAKIIAKGNYDNTGVSYTNGDSDGDGYKANFGGDDQVSTNNRCYVQDYKTGRAYELNKIKNKFSGCPSGTKPVCVENVSPSPVCEDPNPAYNPSVPDPNIPEKIQVTKNVCQAKSEAKCKIENYDEMENYNAVAFCNSGSLVCASENTIMITGKGYVFGKNETVPSMCSQLYAGGTGATCSSIGSNGSPDCTFEEGDNLCKHLFADPKISGEESGDGNFSAQEEYFWKTDPKNRSTANNGQVDEANIVGLGVDQFKWTYIPGDKVGVVVEGATNLPTKHDDASVKIMWALPKNVCKAFDKITEENISDVNNDWNIGFYREKIQSDEVGILAADFDINECLEENLLDPGNLGEGNLELELTYTPESPTNDPLAVAGASNGDEVTVQAGIKNGEQGLRNMFYSWYIEKSSDGSANPTRWIDITKEAGISRTKGLGMNSLSFVLSLPESVLPLTPEIQYIKVKVKAEENADGSERSGNGEVIIKISQANKNIAVHPAIVESSGKISFPSPDKTICKSGNDKYLCPVAKNEIIGLTVEDPKNELSGYSWKVNEEDFVCDSTMSSDCQGGSKQDQVIFFPVLGEEGEAIEVVLSATNRTTGDVTKISKIFKIVEPKVSIVSANENYAWPKITGYTKNLAGQIKTNYSENILQAFVDSKISLQAKLYPEWISGVTYNWKMNGIELEQKEKEISLDVNDNEGESTNIDLAAVYSLPAANRKALSDYWGVDMFETRSSQLDASLQIESILGETLEDSNKIAFLKSKFFANVLSNLPMQTLFIMRIVLTGFLMLIVMAVISAIIPETMENKK